MDLRWFIVNITPQKFKNMILLTFLLLFTQMSATMLDYTLMPSSLKVNNQYMSIKILDTKELKFDTLNGIEFSEVSDLAYRNNRLFGLSDRGSLYEMSIWFKNNKIESLNLINATKLKDSNLNLSKKRYSDSEGLAFVGKYLLVSFERMDRVDLYRQDASKIRNIKINKALRDLNNYAGKNKGLESVTYSSKYGLITAPEEPLKSNNKKYHTIYAKNKKWKFKANGSITGMEFISKNKILILLRDFNYFTRHRYTSLVEVNLKNCKKRVCKSKIIARLDSSDGWNLDNFEGLTRVGKNRFLMISDDNESLLQKTLLVYFEVINQ